MQVVCQASVADDTQVIVFGILIWNNNCSWVLAISMEILVKIIWQKVLFLQIFSHAGSVIM